MNGPLKWPYGLNEKGQAFEISNICPFSNNSGFGVGVKEKYQNSILST